MSKIIIGRPIEGISINGLEYVLNEDGSDYLYFESEDDAKDFLRENGVTDEDYLNNELRYVDVTDMDLRPTTEEEKEHTIIL